tara:strand:- start:10788 stop:11021 length:234 start_codon:yes stop_codon:yes gene_type:complete
MNNIQDPKHNKSNHRQLKQVKGIKPQTNAKVKGIKEVRVLFVNESVSESMNEKIEDWSGRAKQLTKLLTFENEPRRI